MLTEERTSAFSAGYEPLAKTAPRWWRVTVRTAALVAVLAMLTVSVGLAVDPDGSAARLAAAALDVP